MSIERNREEIEVEGGMETDHRLPFYAVCAPLEEVCVGGLADRLF